MKTFFVAFLALLALPSCEAPSGSPDTSFAVAFLRAVGDDILQHEGTQALAKHRDGAKYLALVDTAPKDGVLTLAELEPFFAAPTPETAAMLVILVLGIQRARSEQ